MITFSPKQKQIIRYVAKHDPIHLILEGAVRSGKTFLNNALWAAHVSKYHGWGVDFIITGHTIGSVQRNVIKDLSDIVGDIRLDNKNAFTLFGNKVHCFGAETYADYKAMTGFTSYGWLANEVILQHINTIQEAFNRCSGKGARYFWDTNPAYPDHFIKTDYIDKSGERLVNGKERIKAFHFELEDNPFLTHEYVENLKANTPHGMWYDRKILGLWVAAEGLVYENFNREIHVIEPFEIPAHWKRYRAIDFGYTNPFVCLWGALDEDGRLFIYNEYKQAQVLLKDHFAEINKRREIYTDVYGETRNIEYTTISDHDAQDNAELRNLGIYTRNAIKDVSLGIQKVAERLVIQKDDNPRHFFFNTCKETIKEIGKYAWAEKKEGKPIKEEPVKVDDHCCLIGNTKVATLNGFKKIKDIIIGDLVYTRIGFKRVYDSGMTGLEKVIKNNGIIGTANHIVITGKGNVNLSYLTKHDKLFILNHSTYLKDRLWEIRSHIQKLYALMESIIIKAAKKDITNAEASSLKMDIDIYIEMFGNITSKQFLKVVIFTIKTAIKKIIQSIILNAKNRVHTVLNILKNGILKTVKKQTNILIILDRSQKNGINQGREEIGIRNMVKNVGKIIKHLLKHVCGVIVNMKLHSRQDQNGVVVDVRLPREGVRPVYNISVEDAHEYYANGILVKNCDALRYMIAEIDLRSKIRASDISAGDLGL